MIIGGGVVPLFGKVGWEVADATLAESPAKAASTRRGNPILEVSPELEHLLRARDSVKGRRVARGVLELLCEPLNGIHHARGHLARVGHDARREDRKCWGIFIILESFHNNYPAGQQDFEKAR